MRVEEGDDAAAGVLRGGFVVPEAGREPREDGEQQRPLVPRPVMVVDEPVPGAAVLLHVVLDPGRGERLLEACRRATKQGIPSSIAADDGTRVAEETAGLQLIARHPVVDARGQQPVT